MNELFCDEVLLKMCQQWEPAKDFIADECWEYRQEISEVYTCRRSRDGWYIAFWFKEGGYGDEVEIPVELILTYIASKFRGD